MFDTINSLQKQLTNLLKLMAVIPVLWPKGTKSVTIAGEQLTPEELTKRLQGRADEIARSIAARKDHRAAVAVERGGKQQIKPTISAVESRGNATSSLGNMGLPQRESLISCMAWASFSRTWRRFSLRTIRLAVKQAFW